MKYMMIRRTDSKAGLGKSVELPRHVWPLSQGTAIGSSESVNLGDIKSQGNRMETSIQIENILENLNIENKTLGVPLLPTLFFFNDISSFIYLGTVSVEIP